MKRRKNTITLRIEALKNERNLTYGKMDELTGIDYTTLSKLARGDVDFRQWHIEALCKGLDIEPCDLFTQSGRSDRSRRAMEIYDSLSDEWQEFVLAQLEGALERQRGLTQPE